MEQVEQAGPQVQVRQDELDEIRLLAYEDPVFFCEHLLNHWFPTPMPWVHRGILAILLRRVDFLPKYGELDKIISNFVYRADPTDPDSPELPVFQLQDDGSLKMTITRFTVLKLPRGYSKTTLDNAAVVISICYQERDFIVYISESANHSGQQLKNIRREFEDNDLIRDLFGNLVPDKNSTNKWTERQADFLNGVTLTSVGRHGQIRGSNVGAKRPALILLDDVEDEESVRTEEQREAVRDWFFGAVLPALPSPQMYPDASIVAAGTYLHKDGLLQKLERSPGWTTISFGAVDRQGDMLWEAHQTKEQLDEIKQLFAAAGKLNLFYKEYHNEEKDEEGRIFKSRYIQEATFPPSDIAYVALACDPAIGEKKKACKAAFSVVGMTKTGYIYTMDSFGKVGMDPREKVDKLFELYYRWKPHIVGIESVGYQKALVFLVKEEMHRKGLYFEVKPIPASQHSKPERLTGVLQPRYAAGYVYHRCAFPGLNTELTDYPFGSYDDEMDAECMAVMLLDPAAAYAIGNIQALTGNEYEPLDYVGGAP